MIPKPLATGIVIVVTLVWLANFAAQFLVPGYQVDGYIHGIFFSVVGGALVASRKGGQGPSGPEDPPDPPATATGGPPSPPPPPEPPRASGAHRAALALFPRSVMA